MKNYKVDLGNDQDQLHDLDLHILDSIIIEYSNEVFQEMANAYLTGQPVLFGREDGKPFCKPIDLDDFYLNSSQ